MWPGPKKGKKGKEKILKKPLMEMASAQSKVLIIYDSGSSIPVFPSSNITALVATGVSTWGIPILSEKGVQQKVLIWTNKQKLRIKKKRKTTRINLNY